MGIPRTCTGQCRHGRVKRYTRRRHKRRPTVNPPMSLPPGLPRCFNSLPVLRTPCGQLLVPTYLPLHSVPVVVPGLRHGGHPVFGVALKQQADHSSSEESHQEYPSCCYDTGRSDPSSFESGRQQDPQGHQPHSSRSRRLDPRDIQSPHTNLNQYDTHTDVDSLDSSDVDSEQDVVNSCDRFSAIHNRPAQDSHGFSPLANQERTAFSRNRLHMEPPLRFPDARHPMPIHGHAPSLPLPARCFSQVTRRTSQQQQQCHQKPIGISSFKSAASASFKIHSSRPSYPVQVRKRVNPYSHQAEQNNIAEKKRRFQRTAEVLKKSGLMEITLQSAKLLKQNKVLQMEIDELKLDTIKFIRSVMKNPENQQERML